MPPKKNAAKIAEAKAKLSKIGIKFPSGQEVYDMLMKTIEPELLTRNLNSLDAPYATETPKQRKARYKRYANAFARYKELFSKWQSNVKTTVRKVKRSVIQSKERMHRLEEEKTLQALAAQMQ